MTAPHAVRLVHGDDGAAPAATLALEWPVQTIDVWPGCTYALSRAEAAVVASPPFQRLRRLRQMGLAFHAWPNAENTRASHSLGVAAWSAAYLDALRQAPDAATRAGLAEARAGLDGLSLDLVLRLFALVHDIDLLPLGHTLRYQSGLFGEGPGHPRRAACVAAIVADAERHAFRDAPTDGERRDWLAAFERHLDAATGTGTWLTAEIVNSGLGTDLVDFALRDSFAIARTQAWPGALLGGLRLVELPAGGGWGLALDVADTTAAAARVAVADDLYRARFEVFEASVFHPVKLAADAMLDLVLRRLGGPACASLLPQDALLAMGDDELLARLAAAEATLVAGIGPGAEPVGLALQAGRLHEEVWRTTDLAAFGARPGSAAALALDREWRSRTEAALTASLPGAAPGDVIVAVSAPTMQAKPANARFVGMGGAVFTLADAPAHGFATRARETAALYRELWSLRVYLAPGGRGRVLAAAVAAAADALLGGS